MSETWWVLAGLSATAAWTPGEESRAAYGVREARRALPRRRTITFASLSVDWDYRADIQLLKAIRPGDAIVAIMQSAGGRWVVPPAYRLLRQDTLWRPSMRRTTMLTVRCAPADVTAPLSRVLRALEREGVRLRRGGRQSYAITAPPSIEVLHRVISVDGLRAMQR